MILSFLRTSGALLLIGIAAGCASRELPSRFPQSSPASVEASAGRSAQVTRALDGDPGEVAERAEPPTSTRSEGPATDHEGHHDHAH